MPGVELSGVALTQASGATGASLAEPASEARVSVSAVADDEAHKRSSGNTGTLCGSPVHCGRTRRLS